MSEQKFKEVGYGAIRTDIEPEALDTHSISDGDCTETDESNSDTGLTRTGRIFGGLLNDLKRKLPWYPSDYTDGFSLQVLGTWLFLYFACLTPMITFGGLMGIATHNNMGIMETMLSGCICGITFALFSGQPLIILGVTGPILVFEKILLNFCESNDLAYLEFRCWVGIWIGVILILLVATDACAFSSYVTRFTQENFATFIACIFMIEAVRSVMHIRTAPLNLSYHLHETANDLDVVNVANLTTSYSLIWDYDMDFDGLEDEATIGDDTPSYFVTSSASPETDIDAAAEHKAIYYFSLLLFLGTFLISFTLKEFRNSSFFPKCVRNLVSDFGVVVAIVGMSGIDLFVGVSTPKLLIPREFAPTNPTRGSWLISPLGQNPAWSILPSIIPALLATILIFMDQQITAVMVNRKDHKLKKGAGYHLDLFILSILIIVCSFLGLPWFVAATVESLTNVSSLQMDSAPAAPGEKPTFIGVREQRVSNILIFTTIGLSVLFTPILSHVPQPVLLGVLLYMSFSTLRKMELIKRILLVFTPAKYQQDHNYLKQVPLWKVHLFTATQIICLGIAWVIKSTQITAIFFPFMFVVMMFVRKLLDYVFSQSELNALDDPLPSSIKNENIRRLSSIRSTRGIRIP